VEQLAEEEQAKRQEELKEKMEKEAKEKEEARKRAEFEAMPEDEKKRISNQKEAEAKKNQGNEFYKKRKFSEAITAYNAAVELDP